MYIHPIWYRQSDRLVDDFARSVTCIGGLKAIKSEIYAFDCLVWCGGVIGLTVSASRVLTIPLNQNSSLRAPPTLSYVYVSVCR
jgi:hypothetical protein